MPSLRTTSERFLKISKRIVVGDLEANGLYDSVTTIWCGVFKELKGKRIWKFAPNQIGEMLKFLDTVDVLIMHNGIGYDLPVLEKLYNYKFKGKVVDTLLMSRLQKPGRRVPVNCPNKRAGPHSVEAWGYRVGRGKPEHNDWDNFSPAMLHRCTEDVEIQILIYNALMEEASGKNWRNAHLLTFELFKGIGEQERYGWLLDKEYAEKSIKLLTHFMDRIDRVLERYLPMKLVVDENKVAGSYNYVKKPFLKSGDYSAVVERWHKETNMVCRVGGPFSRISFRKVNLNSNAETKDFLLGAGWIPEHWNTNDEGERTSPKLSHGDSFEGIQGSVGRLVARRVQARHRRSQIEGWLSLMRPDGRVSARVTGLAETGRAKHAGIVNVPGGEAFFGKQMRKCFICKEGFKIVGTDSAGCQNRMLAARVGDDFFTNTLINGKKEDGTSIHHVNQRAIRDVAGIEVSYGKAKGLNYAFMFGASDNKLGTMVGGTQAEGARIREALLSVAAGFSDLVERLTKEWRSNAKRRMNKWGKMEFFDGWVKGLDGRPIFIASEHQILVYVLQSDEAIMMSAAYCLLFKRAKKRGWVHGKDWGMLAWIHDEYQCEVREDISEDFARLAEQCIVDAGKFYNIQCPHKGESDIGINWCETH